MQRRCCVPDATGAWSSEPLLPPLPSTVLGGREACGTTAPAWFVLLFHLCTYMIKYYGLVSIRGVGASVLCNIVKTSSSTGVVSAGLALAPAGDGWLSCRRRATSSVFSPLSCCDKRGLSTVLLVSGLLFKRMTPAGGHGLPCPLLRYSSLLLQELRSKPKTSKKSAELPYLDAKCRCRAMHINIMSSLFTRA